MRGMLVGELYQILSSTKETKNLVNFLKQNNIKEVTLYTGGPTETRVIPNKMNELRDLIYVLRLNDIRFISIAIGSTIEMDRVNAFIHSYNVKIDGLWLEYEWWNHSPRDFSKAVSIIKYMRDKSNPGTVIGSYIGWINQEEMNDLVKLIDRIYIHSYVDNGTKIYSRIKSRLNMIKAAAPKRKIQVFPIISAEWHPSEICNQGNKHPDYYNVMCFLGPWMKINGGFNGAESIFKKSESVDNIKNTITWRDFAEIQGFYYYSYKYCIEAGL